VQVISYPNHGSKTLSDSHQGTLYGDSGIDPPVEAERGTFTASRGKDVPQDHGWLPKKPGIVFPVHTLDGGIFYRLRPDNPGRFPKYMQPKGHPNRLDVHPRQHERIKKPGGMRYVTEGERKVDAGVSRDVLMVGQSGVFNGQRDKGAALIDDWYELPIDGEEYAICFDSDIYTNESVQLAADRLARLLKAEGAKVFISLLPPAPDGSKQGLDDFFANGGTVHELKLLTMPYDEAVVERVRLTRDQKLRAAIEALWRKWWETSWTGQGGHTDRDLAIKVIEAARKHGKVIGDDLRVVKAWGPLMVEAKISSSRTMGKSVARLEGRGFFERDNKGRKADKPGAFMFRAAARAGVKQYGEGAMLEEATVAPNGDSGPCTLHLRAPRLRWSKPKQKAAKKTRRKYRKGEVSYIPDPQEGIRRLGKVRGAVIDALDAHGGTMTLDELCITLNHKRPRDVRRRVLPMLVKVGIIHLDGDTISLTEGWALALKRERVGAKEVEADELARVRYLQKSKAFHNRNKEPEPSEGTGAGRRQMRLSHKKRREGLAAIKERAAVATKPEYLQKAEAYTLKRLGELGHIRLGLLQDIWRDDGGDPLTISQAVESLGCRTERLPGFGDAIFVYPPRAEGVA
jgi:hypothetical protein